MFKNRIIETLFTETQNDSTLQETEEIHETHRNINYAECKLDKFIKKKVRPRDREKLNELIKNNIEAVSGYYIEVMKIYYERGYVDCAEIIKTILL